MIVKSVKILKWGYLWVRKYCFTKVRKIETELYGNITNLKIIIIIILF